MTNLTEPPSCHSALVFIGKNRRGQWVAQEQNGLYGGLFISRTAALRYALFETNHHPEAIRMASSPLELNMRGDTSHESSAPQETLTGGLRQVA